MTPSLQPAFASKGLQDLVLQHDVGVDTRTGAATINVPIPLTPGRGGCGPSLALAYSSGSPNSPYGLGWTLSALSSVGLHLREGLPRYDGTDRYSVSGAEIVPLLLADGARRTFDAGDYWVHFYTSRVERTFARFEKWVDKTTQQVHWRVRDRSNTVSIFGLDGGGSTQIADPADSRRVFEWLPEAMYDAHGNAIRFEYLAENADGVGTQSYERGRDFRAQRYLKRILYGNTHPLQPETPITADLNWLFEVVLDYGEHDADPPAYEVRGSWSARTDPFSAYRAGFEVRTHRLCRRFLMFHNFPELGDGPTLVGALSLLHRESAAGSTITGLAYSGFRRGAQDGSYSSKSLPVLRFTYSEPSVANDFVAAPEDSQENAPQGLGSLNYRWVDLHGEGLPGILFETDRSWLFKPNEGNGRLGEQQIVLEKPASVPGALAFSDFDGDGNLNLVALQGREAGYYEYDRDVGGWSSFRPFLDSPHVKSLDTTTQLLDVNGDGRADILTVGHDRITWYRSKGRDGFEAGVDLAKPRSRTESRTPIIGPSPGLDYFFADMTGDGLPDQVRIQNGRIEYWPQLGNGHFGLGVVMEGAPVLDFDDALDAGRIRLVDLDGSGTADLVYIGRGEIRYWHNASGNRFGPGVHIRGLPTIDNVASAQVLDFTGDGTPCLVWSNPLPGGPAPIHFLRLTNGIKPRLLTSVDNSMGREVEVTYGHSATHYLRDKRSGRGWLTKLPQHVTVVDRLTVVDHIGQTRFQSLYEYHDGCFDGEERAFRGFSLVDQYDSETSRGATSAEIADFADPACVRTWFHNGKAGWESKRMGDFYRGDAQANSMPGSFIESETPEPIHPEEFADAYRALAGQPIRTEVYGVEPDGTRRSNPFQITESNYRIRRIQPRRGKEPASFAVFQSESLTYTYEQDPSDPRITHSLALQIDGFGNVTRSCSIGYPRRAAHQAGVEGQDLVHATVTDTDLLNIDGADRYELGIPQQSFVFELSGFTPQPLDGFDALFWREQLAADLAGLLGLAGSGAPEHILRHDQAFTGGAPEARLTQWSRDHYWNDDRSGQLAWPGVGALPLVHHTENAVGTNQLFHEVFGSRITPGAARAEGHYGFHDEHWWQDSPVLHYLPAAEFDLLSRETRLLDGRPIESSYDYDRHRLVLARTTDAVGNVTRAAAVDYHLPAPSSIVDPNDNVLEVTYDALGVVAVASQHGRILSEAGVEVDFGNEPLGVYRLQSDPAFADVIADPERFLQGASSFLFYDLDAWTLPDPQPLRSVSLVREEFVHDGQGRGSQSSGIQIQVVHTDGFGRTHQVKERVGPGPALDVDAAGALVSVATDTRWRSSGGTVYNNKGLVVRQFEPFFSTTHEFESDDLLEAFGVSATTQYDPAGRAIRVRYPNGTESRTEYRAWETVQHDPNDTVLAAAEYYDARIGRPTGDPERLALEQALRTADTPIRTRLDPLGREVELLEDGGADGTRRTVTRLDINGDAIAVLGNAPDPAVAALRPTFSYRRDMLGRVLHEHGIDSGDRRTFHDALDRTIHLWDGRGVHQRLGYDALDRPASVFVDEALGLNQFTERLFYGDEPGVPDATLRNLRGQLFRHFDQAGIVTHRRYDPGGQVLSSERQILQNYRDEPAWAAAAWDDVPAGALEPDAYATVRRFDAIGRVAAEHLADGTRRRYVHHRGGGIRQVMVTTADGALTDRPFLDDATYNARGQRIEALLGNGVTVTYEYDPETYRLSRLHAHDDDPETDATLRTYQDIRYAYDPAGNIVHLADRAQAPPSNDILLGLPSDVGSVSEYTYDAFYQLLSASGRTHDALQQHDYNSRRDGQPAWIKGTRSVSLDDARRIRRYHRRYTYDLCGNLSRIEHHVPRVNGGANLRWRTDFWVSTTSNRSLPALDLNGLSVSDPESRFDSNGNCLFLPHVSSLAWNYRNNLSRVVIVPRGGDPDRPDDAEYYMYGADGQRVRKVRERLTNAGVETTEKIYLDGCEIKRIRDGQGGIILERTTSHVGDGNQALARVHEWTVDALGRETDSVDRKGIHYQLANHLGSASLELDEDRAIICYEEYFPFGRTSFISGRSDQEVRRKDYRYSGKECDDATSLYYYGFRYMAPWLGRWLSPDPLGPVDGPNLYLFVRNNPTTVVDSNGLQAMLPVPFDRLPASVQLQGVGQRHIEVLAVPDPAGVLLPQDATILDEQSDSEARARFRQLGEQAVAEERDVVLLVYDRPTDALRGEHGQLGAGLTITAPPSILAEPIPVGQAGREGHEGGHQPIDPDQLAADLEAFVAEFGAGGEEAAGTEDDAQDAQSPGAGLGGTGSGLGNEGRGRGGGGVSATQVGAGGRRQRRGSGVGAEGSGTGRRSSVDGSGSRGRRNAEGVRPQGGLRPGEGEGSDRGPAGQPSRGDSSQGVRTSVPLESATTGTRSGLEGSAGAGGVAPGNNTSGSRLGLEEGSQQGSLLSGGEGGTEAPDTLDDVASAVGIASGDFLGYDPHDPNARESGIPGGVLGWLDGGETFNQLAYIIGSVLMLALGGINTLSRRAQRAVSSTVEAASTAVGNLVRRYVPHLRRALRRLGNITSSASTGLTRAGRARRARGEPFAFGIGARSARASTLANEAAQLSGFPLSRYVDDVRYAEGVSSFDVDEVTGQRILTIGSNAFGRTRSGQLLEAAHELVHAQQWELALRRHGGNFHAAYHHFFGAGLTDAAYAVAEVAAETISLNRIARSLNLSPQQVAAARRYINSWIDLPPNLP